MKAHYSAELDSEIANRYKEAVAKKEDLGWLDEVVWREIGLAGYFAELILICRANYS